MENVKEAIRAELEGLSKEELIDVIASFVEVCYESRLISRINSTNHISECIRGIQTKAEPQINGMRQRLNISFKPSQSEDDSAK